MRRLIASYKLFLHSSASMLVCLSEPLKYIYWYSLLEKLQYRVQSQSEDGHDRHELLMVIIDLILKTTLLGSTKSEN
jgi:hypothetical protein